MRRLVPLAGSCPAGGGPGEGAVTTGTTPFVTAPHARLAAGDGGPGIESVGFKAARLGAAARAGLPVLPGWVVPVSLGGRAMGAGVAAIRAHGLGAGRVAVLGVALDADLVCELGAAVDELGGRVIVRSSSPLEGDGRWAGGVLGGWPGGGGGGGGGGGASPGGGGPGGGEVAAAVRSCWASAFAVD